MAICRNKAGKKIIVGNDMRELVLAIDRSTFSLIWMSLHARESDLLKQIEEYGEGSDEGSNALNDIVALRLYKNELKKSAEKVFDANAFIVEPSVT